MKPTCKLCKKNFKVLTQEGLCAFCFYNKNKFWSKEFSAGVNSKGDPNPPAGHPMKFRKTKQRNKKRKKKKGK